MQTNPAGQKYPVPAEVRRACSFLCDTSIDDLDDDDPLWDDNPGLKRIYVRDDVPAPYIEVKFTANGDRIRSAVENELARGGLRGVRVEYVQM